MINRHIIHNTASPAVRLFPKNTSTSTFYDSEEEDEEMESLQKTSKLHNTSNNTYFTKLLTNFYVRLFIVVILALVIYSVILWRTDWTEIEVKKHQKNEDSSLTSSSNSPYSSSHPLTKAELLAELKSLDYMSQTWMLHQQQNIPIPQIYPFLEARKQQFNQQLDVLTMPAFHEPSGVTIWDLYPPTITCPDVQRLGRIGEGGKWICGLTHLQQQKQCLIYSFGISTDISFEVELLLRTNCKIYAFDPTVGKLPFHNLPYPLNETLSKNEALRERIIFQKVALSTKSGSSLMHSYQEHLFDTMHRLGHYYIDILKVDIEGGEWQIFQQLQQLTGTSTSGNGTATGTGTASTSATAGQHSNSSALSIFNFHLLSSHTGHSTSHHINHLPVGQVLIELHHQSMTETKQFFDAMYYQWAMQVYSREVNLLPTLGGQLPTACEYSFINPEHFYSYHSLAKMHHSFSSAHLGGSNSGGAGNVGSNNAGGNGNVATSTATHHRTGNNNPNHHHITTTTNHGKEELLMQLVPIPVITTTWHDPIHAVIYYLVQHKRVYKLKESLILLYRNFLKDFPYYPVVIFHDDLTLKDETLLQEAVPRLKLRFIFIQLALPTNVKVGNATTGMHKKTSASSNGSGASRTHSISDRTSCDPSRSTIGYRHMCRFHAHSIHQHLDDANIFPTGALEYIMRLDDDSYFTQPIGYDLFRYLHVNQKKYGFINTLFDEAKCVIGLWEKSRQFFSHSSHYAAKPQNFLMDWPDPLVIYNNFEISHTSIWKDPIWHDYMKFIDEEGGIYTHRWGDAPLHTIGIAMILKREEIHSFSDIAYQHLPFVNQTSRGFTMPQMDAFLTYFISCQYYDNWRCRLNTGANLTTDTLQNFTLAYSEGVLNLQDSSNTAGTSKNSLSMLPLREKENSKSNNNREHLQHISYVKFAFKAVANLPIQGDEVASRILQSAVLFTFAHRGREDVLIQSILSFYQQFAMKFQIPFIVFHEKGNFEISKFQKKLSQVLKTSGSNGGNRNNNNKPWIKFIAVPLPRNLYSHNKNNTIVKEAVETVAVANSTQLDDECLTSDVEIQAASYFLRYQAMLKLKDLGYQWYFRFGDDSRLVRPIEYNIFEDLEKKGIKYAYLESMPGREKCLAPLWSLGERMCSSLQSTPLAASTTGSKAVASPKCSPLFTSKKWNSPDNHHVILTNFEISHQSVWESSLAKLLFATVERDPLRGLESVVQTLTEAETLRYADSALHTLLVTMSLKEEEILLLTNIFYNYHWHSQVSSSKQEEHMQQHLYHTANIDAYNAAFTTRRYGWLGGDIAGSIVLPKLKAEDVEEKVIWLFGDSVLGVANAKRRLEEHAQMISNTIAITTIVEPSCPTKSSNTSMDVKTIRDVHYYWQENDQEEVEPIFTLNAKDAKTICGGKETSQAKASVWPVNGIAIQIKQKGTVVALVATVVCSLISLDTKPSSSPIEALNFEAKSNLLIVIDNPYEDPRQWKYRYQVLPNVGSHSIKLMSITDSTGSLLATEESTLFLMTNIQTDKKSSISIQNAFHSVLKISAKDLMQLEVSKLQYLQAESKQWQAWPTTNSATVNNIHFYVLYNAQALEATMQYDAHQQQWFTVSLYMLERHFRLCRSPSNFFPLTTSAATVTSTKPSNQSTEANSGSSGWHCVYIADYDDKWNDPGLISYGGKSHPELLSSSCKQDKASSSLRLVLSFVSNPISGPQQLFEEKYRSIYTPKFLYVQQK